MEELDDDWFPVDVDQIINNQPQKLEWVHGTDECLEKDEPMSCSDTHQSSETATASIQVAETMSCNENIKTGWTNLGMKWFQGSGMWNGGNTCYISATLQAIYHIPAFVNWVINDDGEHRRNCDGGSVCIICAVAHTLLETQTNNAITPHLVYDKLKLISNEFTPGAQEDAYEFLTALLKSMKESYLSRFSSSQLDKVTSPIDNIFGGNIDTSVRCTSCDYSSKTNHYFEDLLLEIQNVSTLDEAIDTFFACEDLEDYKCESCKNVSAKKQHSLSRAPATLCIQLKRFSKDQAKINKFITIKKQLDLSKYLTKSNENESMLKYRLVSAITHWGSNGKEGHYTALALTPTGQYCTFDDENEPLIINIPNEPFNSLAYVLFYEMENAVDVLESVSIKATEPLESKNDKKIVESIERIDNNGVVKDTQSLFLYGDSELLDSIDADKVNYLTEMITNLTLQNEDKIADLACDIFGQPIRIPLITIAVAVAKHQSTITFQQKNHDDVNDSLRQQFASINLDDSVSLSENNSITKPSISKPKAIMNPVKMDAHNDTAIRLKRLPETEELTHSFFYDNGLLSPIEVGLSYDQLIHLTVENVFKSLQFAPDTGKKFESYLDIMPTIVVDTFNELDTMLKFGDFGIEHFIDDGVNVLSGKCFPSTGSTPSEFTYLWTLKDIVLELAPIIELIPERVFVTATVILMHLYCLYVGESGVKKIEIRIGNHFICFKNVVVYLLQDKNSDQSSIKYKKYWTLFKALKSSEVIQTTIDHNFDRRSAEGIVYHHLKRFSFTHSQIEFSNSPVNVFNAPTHYTPEEISKVGLYEMKRHAIQMMSSAHVFKLKKELTESIENQISSYIKGNESVIKSYIRLPEAMRRQLLSNNNDSLKNVLTMIISGFAMKLPGLVEVSADNKKIGEIHIQGNLKFSGKITLGATFNSRKEFTDIWNDEIKPYYNGYALYPHNWYYLSQSCPNDTEFIEKYMVQFENAACCEENCPWCFSTVLCRNSNDIMQSYFVLEKLNLTHNHACQKIRWLEFGTINDAVDELETILTNENMQAVLALCNETCRISMIPEANLQATYSYGMKNDQKQHHFNNMKSKMLSLPEAEKQKLKIILLTIVSALKLHLPATVQLFCDDIIYGKIKIDPKNPCQTGVLYRGQRFTSHQQFLECHEIELKPYYNGYKLKSNLKDKTAKALAGNFEAGFLEKFVFVRKAQMCNTDGCPWNILIELWINRFHHLDSYYVIETIDLTHNHANENIDKIKGAPINAVINELQNSVTDENMQAVLALCNETYRILNACPQANLQATYSYGMKNDQKQQELLEKFSETKNKILGIPDTTKENMKNILVGIVCAFKMHLPATLEFYNKGKKCGEINVEFDKISPFVTLRQGQRFATYDDYETLFQSEIQATYGLKSRGFDSPIHIKKLKGSKNRPKSFVKKFEKAQTRRYCQEPDCPFVMSVEIQVNNLDPNKSYYILNKCVLTHNHTCRLVNKKVITTTFENVLNMLETICLNSNNIDQISNTLNDIVNILESGKTLVQFTHSYVMKCDEVNATSDNVNQNGPPPAKKPKKSDEKSESSEKDVPIDTSKKIQKNLNAFFKRSTNKYCVD